MPKFKVGDNVRVMNMSGMDFYGISVSKWLCKYECGRILSKRIRNWVAIAIYVWRIVYGKSVVCVSWKYLS